MKILVTSPTMHDGKPVKVGAVIDLPAEQAEALVSAGVAEQPGKKKPGGDAGDGTDTGAKA